MIFFFQAEDGIRDLVRSRGLGDVYKRQTLPYYIPFPPIPLFPINFGTMGAVIRTKSLIYSKKAMFDIGIAGPLSGFVICLGILIYGFTHVPSIDYLLNIHPDYFSPDYDHKNKYNAITFNCITCGAHLRDYVTLYNIIKEINKLNFSINFIIELIAASCLLESLSGF